MDCDILEILSLLNFYKTNGKPAWKKYKVVFSSEHL